MPFQITSAQNSKVKEAARLDKRSERDMRRVTRVEGLREVERALEAGIVPTEAYVCHDMIEGAKAVAAVARLEELDGQRGTRLYSVTAEAFARLALREESGGIVLVIPYVQRDLADLPTGANPFICTIEGVEKPGNLGAILRTADGAGVDAVIVTEPHTDLYNPNVIRASLGAIFSVPVLEVETDETLACFRSRAIQIVAAHPEAETLYTNADYRGPTAIVMGSEADGLSELWRAQADALVRIPMRGCVDSLNLASATALLLYEVVRQRSI